MRLIAAVLCVLASFVAYAAQNGTVTFDVPNTGGAPSGYRLFRDGVLVGTLTSGQTLTALAPNDVGTYVIGVEAVNATGPGTRVNKTVVLGPPPLPVPGPVRNLQITLNCSTTTPPTCTVAVSDAP